MHPQLVSRWGPRTRPASNQLASVNEPAEGRQANTHMKQILMPLCENSKTCWSPAMVFYEADVNAEGNHVNEMRGDPAARVAHRPAQSVRASTSAATSVSRVQQVELEARQAGDEPVLPSRLAHPSLKRRKSAIPGADLMALAS